MLTRWLSYQFVSFNFSIFDPVNVKDRHYGYQEKEKR